ncbi:lysophospholipid acyltransferase family protein [Alkalihalobacterium elongatum]|uniref:lysophospholipid acyltransferase family protein n=1 Tax=Alkalihalobacterium elongatum TaxID=2675466 RepID=UPI001C1F5859|nr:lysophospholipid acyltransferase family protein [Alkalihalobacterium elongatum]
MFYYFLRMIISLYLKVRFRIEVIGKNNIPIKGALIIAANHVSHYDPIIIMCLVKRKIHFLAKVELFKFKITRWFFRKVHAIPIDRNSKNMIRSIRESISTLDEDKVLGIFPEGKRLRVNEVVKPKKGVGFFALKSQAPILPISIIGLEQKRLFRQPIKVVVSEAIKYDDIGTSNYEEIAQYVMDMIEKNKRMTQR